MNISELKQDDLNLHLKVSIPSKDMESEVDKELLKIAKTAKMAGFRVGKVPPSILKKKYSNSLYGDAVRSKISDAIKNITKDRNLRPVTDPSIDDLKAEQNQDLEFTVKYELLPEIKMPDFSKIAINKPVLEVSEKDVDEQIDKLVGFSKNYEKEVKGKAKSGDQVTIDAIGYVDGKAFNGGKLEGHKLVLGSNAFIPGFEDQLIGSKAGDDVSVKVPFPKEYHSKDLAGKDSEFKVKVLAVHSAELPKIDDEFAKKFRCDTVEKLKEQITENIKFEFSDAIHTFMKMKLFDQLEKLITFEVPSSLLSRELSILSQQAKGLEEDPSIKEKSESEKEKYYSGLASRRVKLGLMLAEYVQKNNLAIDENDLRQAIISEARKYPGQEQQVIEYFSKDRNALESLKGPILEEKAVKEIFDKEIKVTEKTYKKDKLEKLLEEENI